MSTANYNRIYSTMFEGSLYGKGPLPIACWAYVLAEMKPDFGKEQFYVELNPEKVAHAIGKVEEGAVVALIEEFCSPDEKSRNVQQDGRRLVREGQFTYLVVNGAMYNEIKKREAKREQNRLAQQRYRGKPKVVRQADDNEPSWVTADKEERFRKSQSERAHEEAWQIAIREAEAMPPDDVPRGTSPAPNPPSPSASASASPP